MMTWASLVARYQLGRELGRGGMGAVYECSCRQTGRRIALKLSTNDVGTIAQSYYRREAKIVAGIHHPNVARVIGHGVSEGRVWIAMEAVEGGTLADRMLLSSFGLRPRLRVLRELAAVLADLHLAGVVHNDLKPANIMFAVDGSLRLIDFGIADLRGHRTPRALLLAGTPYAIPPEKLTGDSSDHRADIFQLGVLAYDVFCDHHPWERSNTFGTAYAICTEAPSDFMASLSTRSREHPEEMALIAPLIAASLARQPEHRPSSTHAWVTTLDAVLATIIELEEPVWSDTGGMALACPA